MRGEIYVIYERKPIALGCEIATTTRYIGYTKDETLRDELVAANGRRTWFAVSEIPMNRPVDDG